MDVRSAGIPDELFEPWSPQSVGEDRERQCRESENVLLSELVDDVVEVLLGTQTFPFKHLNNRGNLPHIGDRRFFDGHRFACGTLN